MNSSIFNSKKIPWAFILTVVIVVLIESFFLRSTIFLEYCYKYAPPLGADPLRVKGALAVARRISAKKVLFTGSSQMREGVDVSQLNVLLQERNAKAFNIGISGGEPMDILMLSDEILKSKPTLLIYMPFFSSFYGGNYDYRKMKLYFNPSILPYIKKILGTRELLAQRAFVFDSYLGQIVPSLRYRMALKVTIGDYLKAVVTTRKIRSYHQQRLFAYKKSKPEEYFRNVLIKNSGRKKSYHTKYTQLEKIVFQEFLRKAHKQDVKLIVISGPCHPFYYKLHDEYIMNEYRLFLTNTCAEDGTKCLLEQDLPQFDELDFIDFTHLNARGRDKMTTFLGDFISTNSFKEDN